MRPPYHRHQVDRQHSHGHLSLVGEHASGSLLADFGAPWKWLKSSLVILHGHLFHSAEQLAAYLRLVPVERQSGTSVLGRARLSKAGPAPVHAVLYMAAVMAIRYSSHVKALYGRLLARGKLKKAALGAAMRKLVHLCFGVIKTRSPYQPNYACPAWQERRYLPDWNCI